MITDESNKREIEDLQRLLLAVGMMRPKGAAKWISAPALAAVAAALQVHGVSGQVTSAGVGGGSNIGGGGSIG